MSVKQQVVTAEELWEMPEVPGRRIELVDGQVVDKPLLGVCAGLAKGNLLRTLGDFVEHHDLGLVLPGLWCLLGRDPDQVCPVDLAFITWDRVSEGELPDWFWEGPPTLAVEIVSHLAMAVDVHRCIQDFLDAGSLLVWVVWSDTRSVTVHRLDGTSSEIVAEANLNGGDVLPDFSVRVGDLFEFPQGCL